MIFGRSRRAFCVAWDEGQMAVGCRFLDEFRRRRPGSWTRGATQWHVQGSTPSHHRFRAPALGFVGSWRKKNTLGSRLDFILASNDAEHRLRGRASSQLLFDVCTALLFFSSFFYYLQVAALSPTSGSCQHASRRPPPPTKPLSLPIFLRHLLFSSLTESHPSYFRRRHSYSPSLAPRFPSTPRLSSKSPESESLSSLVQSLTSRAWGMGMGIPALVTSYVRTSATCKLLLRLIHTPLLELPLPPTLAAVSGVAAIEKDESEIAMFASVDVGILSFPPLAWSHGGAAMPSYLTSHRGGTTGEDALRDAFVAPSPCFPS
ncbi:hypothetical protein J3F83DRAFT_739071 [Trichoderma novae-zelandiae]